LTFTTGHNAISGIKGHPAPIAYNCATLLL
jgi:hypothetical protein